MQELSRLKKTLGLIIAMLCLLIGAFHILNVAGLIVI